jgi:mevalonate kinase
LKRKETYTAKVLLFGEYSILLGSSALSIPYGHYTATLNFISEEIYTDLDLAHESNQLLQDLQENYQLRGDYFGSLLDLESFRNDIKNGLYLESTIPKSYGLGSSGALCAAIYARYACNRIPASSRIKPDEIKMLKEIFVNMESVFHMKSSGFDPLVIYLKFPLHIANNCPPEIIRIPRNRKDTTGGIFLVDTGLAVKTGPLVTLFLDKYAPGGSITAMGKALCSLTNACITYLLKGEIPEFFNELKALSLFQLAGLEPMIPVSFRPIWAEGLKKDLFFLKLCGSGGGGFLTGFAPDYYQALSFFRENKIQIVPVYLASNSK